MPARRRQLSNSPHRRRPNHRPQHLSECPRTRTGAAWVALIAATLVAVLLIVFLVQNTHSTEISFLWMTTSTPLAVALLIAAVGSVLLTLTVGRIVTSRWQPIIQVENITAILRKMCVIIDRHFSKRGRIELLRASRTGRSCPRRPRRPTQTGRNVTAGDGSTDMTSGPHLRLATPLATMVTEPPRQTLRLKLKPKATTTGYVDGAWWPRSWDLSAELPALLAVLAVRLGRVCQVSYNLITWNAAHHRLNVDGHQVRLGGFHAQHPRTIDVVAANGMRLTLLVLPPATHPATAHPIMMIAARRNNIDSIDALLAPIVATVPGPRTGDRPDDPAVQRWELDGGLVAQRA
jgi:uncharacterized integral membrane protein